jgi:hypothetical protein
MPEFTIKESEAARRKSYDDLIATIASWVAGSDDPSLPDDVRAMRLSIADSLRVRFAQAAPLSPPILEFEGVTGTPLNAAARAIPRVTRDDRVGRGVELGTRTAQDAIQRPSIPGELARSSRATPIRTRPDAGAVSGSRIVSETRRRQLVLNAPARATVTIRRVM